MGRDCRTTPLATTPGARVTRVPDHDVDSWEPRRSELAADVGRVSDRLRSMSRARLEGLVAPGDEAMPPWGTRAQAGRAMGSRMSDLAVALEATAEARPYPGHRGMPELSVFAAGDQVAVGGHDLLAAMALVDPEAVVVMGEDERRPARERVELTARLLADLRRRL
jgi:hypothetical protein